MERPRPFPPRGLKLQVTYYQVLSEAKGGEMAGSERRLNAVFVT
jgi:hypothetical protein